MKHWHPGETNQPPFVINNVLEIMAWVVLGKLGSPTKCLLGQLYLIRIYENKRVL